MSLNEQRWLSKKEYNALSKKAKEFNATEVDFDHLWHKINFGNNVQVSCMFNPLVCHFSVKSDTQFGSSTNKDVAYQLKQNIDNAMKFIDYLEENYNPLEVEK